MLDRFRESRFGLSEEDWCVLTTSRANVLLVGPDPLTSAIVDALRATFADPIAQWDPNNGTVTAPPCATLLLRQADDMTLDDQQRLDAWLAAGPSPQVITTSTQSLFPFVERGAFLAALYYRLNIVYLTFDDSGIGSP